MHHLSKKKFMTNNLQQYKTTHKNVQNYYNEKCTCNLIHTAICYLLSMELFKLYSQEKTNLFCLN